MKTPQWENLLYTQEKWYEGINLEKKKKMEMCIELK